MFPEKLYLLRKNNHLSQEELSTILHVQKSTISNWEHGKSEPSIAMINKIAQYFGVTTDYLLNPNADSELQKLTCFLREKGYLSQEEDFSEDEFSFIMEQYRNFKNWKNNNHS